MLLTVSHSKKLEQQRNLVDKRGNTYKFNKIRAILARIKFKYFKTVHPPLKYPHNNEEF